MPSYQMDFDTFLNEVKRWKLNTNSMFRVKMSEDDNFYTFCLCLPQTGEEYVSVVKKDEVSEMQKMDLFHITLPARRISENMKAAQFITNKLQEVEDAKNSSPTKRESL